MLKLAIGFVARFTGAIEIASCVMQLQRVRPALSSIWAMSLDTQRRSAYSLTLSHGQIRT
jgi:hypothetical protein